MEFFPDRCRCDEVLELGQALLSIQATTPRSTVTTVAPVPEKNHSLFATIQFHMTSTIAVV